MLPTKFRFIQSSSFRREAFKKSANQKQEWPVAAMFVNGSGQNEQFLQRIFQMLPTKFQFIWLRGFRGNAVLEINKKQELPMIAMFVNGSNRNEQFPQRTFHRCFLASFGPFGQDVSEQKIFRNRPIRNKNCLWQPCLLMDRDKMSNLYREPSIDASYQVSVHLAKQFQRRRFFKNQPIRNNNFLWQPCLLTDRDEISNLDRELPYMLPAAMFANESG